VSSPATLIDVAVACRVLEIPRSSYYDWRGRPASRRDLEDAYLIEAIRKIHTAARASYGAPRVHDELRLGRGLRIGRKRIARLMRLVGLAGIHHRKKIRARPAPATHEDLVARRFVADRPDRLWFTDITEHPTGEGKLYSCCVLDCFSRRIVGWSIAGHVRSELVVDALQMAQWNRSNATGTIVHSDRGSQFTSWIFGHHLRQAGLLGSMGRVASSVDNSMMESFWSTMQREYSTAATGKPATNSPPRSSTGSKASTTPSAGTRRSARCPQPTTKPATPPPPTRHDHHTNPVRESGSGSSSSAAALGCLT
jgi:putative transposase